MLYSMEKILNLKNLKNNKGFPKKYLFFLLVVLVFALGQSNGNSFHSSVDTSLVKLKHLKTINIGLAQNVSIDPYNNIYYANQKGDIFKLDNQGSLLNTFSPKKNAPITSLEAWRNVNILVFYKNFQEFLFLSRFLTEERNLKFREDIGFARIITNSGDNNLWVIDDSDFSLKKYNISLNKVEISTPLDLLLDSRDYNISFIREYQNLLFVNDENSGIMVFDNLGNYKTKIPLNQVKYFSFWGDEISLIYDNCIYLINIYKNSMRKIDSPILEDLQYVLIGGGKVYLFTKNTLEIFTMEG